MKAPLLVAALALALLVAAPAGAGGLRRLEGYRLQVPGGWSLTRGAASDGQMGYLIEPPTVADGEESFVLFERTLAPGGAETTARVLQQEVLASGRPVRAVEKVRLFEVGGHPGARAELTGRDPYGGEPARVIFWVIARDFERAVVFRAILLESRLALFASTLEGLVRSIAFAGRYVAPPPAAAGTGREGRYDPESDVWAGQGERGYSLDGEGEAAPGAAAAAPEIETHVSEVPLADLPPEPGRALAASALTGTYCATGQAEGVPGQSLQFDGKGQWARHQGEPPEKFTLKDLSPNDTGYYRITGTVIWLDAHTGQRLRCSSPAEGALSCQGGLRYEKTACDLMGWEGP